MLYLVDCEETECLLCYSGRVCSSSPYSYFVRHAEKPYVPRLLGTPEKPFSTKAFGPGPARDSGLVKLRRIKKNPENNGFLRSMR